MRMNDTPDHHDIGRDRPAGRLSSARSANDRPLADREVPLRADGGMAALNAWLDGEAPAPRTLDNQLTPEAELWSRISREASARREVRTPSHVAVQIMNALPTAGAQRLVAAPAVHDPLTLVARAVTTEPPKRGIEMPPAAIAILAVACMALGAVLARMF